MRVVYMKGFRAPPQAVLSRQSGGKQLKCQYNSIAPIDISNQSQSPISGQRHTSRQIQRQIRCQSQTKDSKIRAGQAQYPTASGSGGSGGGFVEAKDRGSGGDGDESGTGSSMDISPILAAAGKAAESIPEDMLKALERGKVPKDVWERYLEIDNSFLAPFLNIGGFRERLLADPSFFVKLGIELGIGLGAKGTAEWTKRGEKFGQELDLVTANVLMALIADFCLVWLPAPTLSFKAKSSGTGLLQNNPIQRYFANCPDNAFQKVPSGYKPFTLAQRIGAPVRNGAKLLVVGFGASMFGVGCTNVLLNIRQMLDPNFVPQNPPQSVLTMSAAYASYMAISSNLRYQIIAGVVEERGIEVFLKGNPRLCNISSFIVRTGNTFLGSLLWVDYIRLLGLQK